MTDAATRLLAQVAPRLDQLARNAAAGAFDPTRDLLVGSLQAGGVVQAFGTGHSEAFAMEIAGRAGGLIPTNRISLRDIVLHGSRDASILSGGQLERDASVVDELFDVSLVDPRDVFIIASNSGVNGSIVGMALTAKARGHQVIAVTSLEHTNAVTPKHESGRRLSEIADAVIDTLAPYGDATLTIADGRDHELGVGAVSSMTAAFVAQVLTIMVSERLVAAGDTPPIYISANVPEGDEHNRALEDRYRGRIRRLA
ncbi:sugar isomerase domain-containing protein [soil metagenome]